MRTFFFLMSIGFIALMIYRRIIEPFLEGLRGARKPYNRTQERTSVKSQSRHGLPKDKEIRDAEFTEIK
jgi:hypothetical protein